MSYINTVAPHVRILAHDYFDPSDDSLAYQADEKGLQAVTAAFMAEADMGDVTFWYGHPIYDDCVPSLVPCDGVDPRVDGRAVDIWTYGGRCYENLAPDTRVFVSKVKLEALGHAIPDNLNPALKYLKEAFA